MKQIIAQGLAIILSLIPSWANSDIDQHLDFQEILQAHISDTILNVDFVMLAETREISTHESKIIIDFIPLKAAQEIIYTPQDLQYHGVLFWNNYKWTWYSEKVLPGPGLRIPDRHADLDGYICDKDNYICVASSVLPKGTIVETPFGKKGKVYDCGCANNVIDVYVNW